MRKFFVFMLALLIAGGQVVLADVQIDSGMKKGTAAVKFFIGRNARQSTISADRVVIWDTTSMDGVSVKTTTTSGDKLVAGIAMDTINGVTSDVAATSDTAFGNWGRIQTWGLHQNVYTASGAELTAGRVAITSSTAGAIGDNMTETIKDLSSDGMMVGVAVETDSSNTCDIMVHAD